MSKVLLGNNETKGSIVPGVRQIAPYALQIENVSMTVIGQVSINVFAGAVTSVGSDGGILSCNVDECVVKLAQLGRAAIACYSPTMATHIKQPSTIDLYLTIIQSTFPSLGAPSLNWTVKPCAVFFVTQWCVIHDGVMNTA